MYLIRTDCRVRKEGRKKNDRQRESEKKMNGVTDRLYSSVCPIKQETTRAMISTHETKREESREGGGNSGSELPSELKGKMAF